MAQIAQQYLTNKFGRNDIEWSQMCLFSHRTSIDTKAKIFQYKILNNILHLN